MTQATIPLGELLKDLELSAVTSLDELLKGEGDRPCLLLQDKGTDFVAGDSLDHRADALIYDRLTGTLGLVHDCRVVKSEAKENCRPALTEGGFFALLEKAAQLRYLAVKTSRAGELPLTVEVVFVIGDDQESRKSLFKALSRCRRDTAFYHAIGTNLLVIPPDAAPGWCASREGKQGLDHAFCWLLRHCRKWFDLNRGLKPTSQTAREPVSTILLENWRIEGKRAISLSDGEGDGNGKKDRNGFVHVIHGNNGTGKSSITEGILHALLDIPPAREMTPASQKDRSTLPQATLCRDPGCNHQTECDHKSPAAGAAENEPAATAGTDPHLDRKNALRLNQELIERISKSKGAERYRRILSTYFPGSKAVTEALKQAKARVARAREALPKDLQSTAAAKAEEPLDEGMSWLPGPQHRDLLAMSGASLMLPSPLAAGDDTPPGYDDVVRRIMNPETWQQLQRALDTVDQDPLRSWQASSSSTLDWARQLDDWLHALARADLLERSLQVSQTLSGLQKRQADPGYRNSGAPLADSALKEACRSLTGGHEAALKKEEKEYRAVAGQIPARRQAESDQDPSRPASRPVLPADQAEALDVAGDMLVHTLSPELKPEQKLGQTLRLAIQTNSPRSFGSLLLGSGAWADPIRKALGDMLSMLKNLPETDTPPWPRQERLTRIRTWNQCLREKKEAEEKVTRSLFSQLSSAEQDSSLLGPAFSEMLSLLTSSRWAYPQVQVELKTREEEGEVTFRGIDDSGADWSDIEGKMNTAEISLMVFSLFLLLSPVSENNHNLLLFDDPLQNMDEQTVTHMARGFSRLLPYLKPHGFQYIFLFHGEGDRTRFCQEVPSCVYRLPPMLPAGHAARQQETVRDEKHLLKTVRQSPQGLLKEKICTQKPAGAQQSSPHSR